MTGVLVAAGIALAAVEPSGVTAGFAAGGGAFAVLWVVVGLFVARRVRGNLVGPLLTAVGLAVAFTATREVGWRVLAARPHAAARLDWLVAVLEESSVWLFVALALLLAYFPDGLLPSRKWRPVPWVLVVAALIYQAWGAFEQTPFRSPLQDLPRPFGPPSLAFDLLGVAAEVTLLGLFLGCAGSLVMRFRRSDEVRRRQLKWLALIGIAVPGFLVVCGGELLLLGHPGWASVVVGVAALAGLPIAIAVGMLRHDLYDVDSALSTTIAYVLATGLLLTIFAVASFLTGLAMGRGSTLAAAARPPWRRSRWRRFAVDCSGASIDGSTRCGRPRSRRSRSCRGTSTSALRNRSSSSIGSAPRCAIPSFASATEPGMAPVWSTSGEPASTGRDRSRLSRARHRSGRCCRDRRQPPGNSYTRWPRPLRPWSSSSACDSS